MSFHPGQRVVCVNDEGFDAASWAPKKGGVYVVSQFGMPAFAFAAIFLEGPGVRLEEGDAALPAIERWFSAWRFRPLSEARLDQFRAHLAPTPRVPVSA